MAKNIDLLDVTLCTVDCVDPQLALESLIISSEKINFGNILLFSDVMPVSIPSKVTFIKISKISSLIEYSNFILNRLGQYIKTNFCLTVHADGWIHNPHLWRDSYRDWDYIGAPWPLHLHFVNKDLRVGNGGVSFRSKRLLNETSRYTQINMHEDHFICQYLKDDLQKKDIRIAPLEVARTFSFELECDDCPINPQTECFAFHGKTYTPFHVKQNDLLKQRMKDRIDNLSIIEQKYNEKCNTVSDINEHLPVLLEYANKCDTIAEMGVRHVVSSYAFALSNPKKLLCLDIDKNDSVETFISECSDANIDMEFVHKSSLEYELPHKFDMLFIDTLHTFSQLSKELELHHSKIEKYIIFHDTVFWGHKNENPIDSSDTGERGDNVGLVPAIKNFLKKHEEWKEVCTYPNNNGLTILQRLPYLIYKNVLAGQTRGTPHLLKDIINKNKFSTIIEIGTHRGGLSLWIKDNKPDNCEFYTFDIDSSVLKIDPKKENINFIEGDCFAEGFDTIKDLIQSDKQILLLCDGGNKELEFNTFAPFLKPGDIIMCHDFTDLPLTFNLTEATSNWPSGPESYLRNLEDTIQKYNLKPFCFEEAKLNFWGCFIKAE